MEIIQRLLGGVAQDAVSVTLKGGQIVKGRSFFTFFLALNGHHRCRAGASLSQFQRRLPLVQAFRLCDKAAEIERNTPERRWGEGVNVCFPLNQQGQRGAHNAAYVDPGVIHQGEEAAAIDADQPISFRPADRRTVQTVIISSVPELIEAVPNRSIFHTGDPKALHWDCTACQLINVAKDQFSLASCVAGVYNFCCIGVMQQLFQDGKLFFRVSRYHESKWSREQRKI